MSVRDDVLHMLANEDDTPISGENMASMLGVSRAAVWKAVKRLQEEGYDISGAQNRGYVLHGSCDPMTARGILDVLPPDIRDVVHLTFKQRTGSTNADVMELAKSGAPAFSVVVASSQDSGKGRRGRSFYSPAESGVYLSMLLRPKLTMRQASLVTCSAAVAVCRALERICHVEPAIKWVNDIYVNGTKVCGILTEGTADLETGTFSYAVVGIGVNVYEPEGGFPTSLSGKAGAALGSIQLNARNGIAANIISELVRIEYEQLYVSCIDEYRNHSMMSNARINVTRADGSSRLATAIQVNNDLSLRVAWDDGGFSDLHTEEVSISL